VNGELVTGTALLRQAWQLSRQSLMAEVAALAAPLRVDDLVAEPELGCLVARAWTWTGQPERALALLERIGGAHAGGNDAIHRMRLSNTGGAHYLLGRMEPAEREWTALLLAATEADDYRRVSDASNNLGMVALVQGRYPEALALFERAAAAAQRAGDLLPLATAHLNLSSCYRALGLLDKALTMGDRALELARELGSAIGQATVEGYRSRIFLRRGDLRLAEAAAVRARSRLEGTANPSHPTVSIRNLGDVRVAQGRFEEGLALLGQALRLSRDTGQPLVEVQVLESLAAAHAARGDDASAALAATEAIARLERLGAHRRVERLRRDLAHAAGPGR
jgi:tetratricopeptide (TPR) repeat protein